MRETCIWEMPIRWAICVWVMSPKKRSVRIGARVGQRVEQRPQGMPVLDLLQVRVRAAEPIDDGDAEDGVDGVERSRGLVGPGVECLDDVVDRDPEPRGQLAGSRRAAELLRQRLGHLGDVGAQVLEPARHAQRPGAVAEPAQHLPSHAGDEVAEELAVGQLWVPAVDGGDERDGADLGELLLAGAAAAAGVPSRQVLDDRQECEHQVVAQLGTPRVGVRQRRELAQAGHRSGVLARRRGADGLLRVCSSCGHGHPRDVHPRATGLGPVVVRPSRPHRERTPSRGRPRGELLRTSRSGWWFNRRGRADIPLPDGPPVMASP